MSNTHEALKLADWLAGMVCIHPQVSEDDPGGYATEYDQKVDEGAATIRTQHALIVQMAEALEENHAYIFNHSQSDDFKRYDEAMYAATQYLKGQQ